MPADKLTDKLTDTLTIGVFDSGFGGLTVLRELLPLIPGARYIYLGDTARLPYGSKSHETIARYAVSSARYLHEQGADLLVIACNTATALAFDDIRHAMPIPVIGVIQPGAEAALAASQGQVLVLATQATIQSHAYAHALHSLGLKATEKACPLLVPLVEEGWTNHPVTDEVIKIYLTEALTEAPEARTLLLGCTHYPLIEPAIARVLSSLGHPLTIIDSAQATARTTAQAIATHFPNRKPQETSPTCTFYATDSIEKFQRLGSNFLGQPLSKVHLLDLGG
ncbi:glutamate racemase [Edaphobacter acidisoli]|uniref:Glutamate racemase n=1 Tax=Edaphobacter acidisoli TaxID=2040573 RepID=A0A916RD25_9BACT|nr:glutamate racemase [Edaphobacter acidisoli]GGA53335.1 glutamate racemase [Edaphobacter acidisoli]